MSTHPNSPGRPKAVRGFFDELAVGRYVPASSPLHAAPSLGKAILLALLGVTAFWLESATAFAVLGAGLALVARSAKLPQSLFWRSLRPLLLLASFTLLAGAFLNASVGSLWPPQFSWVGLHKGAIYAARLLFVTLLTTLFFLTTRPQEAISLGVRLLAPLRLLGIEGKELSLLVHLAYRFVPLLAREVQEFGVGRLARNLPPARSPLARAREASQMLVTVVISSLQRAETTGMAMEQRGLLEHWRPAPLAGGHWSGLWPLLALVATSAAMLALDARLL